MKSRNSVRCLRAEKEGIWQPVLRGQVERRGGLHGRRKAGARVMRKLGKKVPEHE